MNVNGSKALVLGGAGLVGMAVCRELLLRKPREIVVHSLAREEAEQGVAELRREAGDVVLTATWGNILDIVGGVSTRDQLFAELLALTDETLSRFWLYQLLAESRPEVVVDCVNTATAIAYRNVFKSIDNAARKLESGDLDEDVVEQLLQSIYVPRLIRHVQVIYRGMMDAGTRVYVKVGTSGTGGMGLNIPYTHSEERPSRQLLSKSAMAGAHSMLLFLLGRTPGAPITKEIKPAAAIAWKRIDHGPIYRKGVPIRLVNAQPRPIGDTFSTHDPDAATVRDEVLETAFIDTGENGIFSLEEFAALTTAQQMEFVTPEEIAQYLLFEIEGGNTGHDIVNALDNAVLGPTYRAGLMRHWALEKMNELVRTHGTHSVAFEMLGPPRLSKLLFEAHLLRLAFGTMTAVRNATAQQLSDRVVALLREQPDVANEVVCVGVPILLPDGQLIRGTGVIVPDNADQRPVTPELIERWVYDGWVDLRVDNCQSWIDRFQRIYDELCTIPPEDTSSRYMRNRRFWDEAASIQPGKVVGWIFSEEEHGSRFKR